MFDTDCDPQNIAAQQAHRDACFALTAWYLVGSPGVLPQSDTEAFLWAKKAADAGLAKAMYAVGYFLEVGIGTSPNMPEYASHAPLVPSQYKYTNKPSCPDPSRTTSKQQS